MIVKNAIYTWRNRLITLIQLLYPVVMTIIGYLTVQFMEDISQRRLSPPLQIELSHFSKPVVPFGSDPASDPAGQHLATLYAQVADRYGEPVSASGSSMDDYLLDVDKRNPDEYYWRYIVAGTANGSDVLVGHFSGFALHSTAMSLSLVDNALLRYSVPGNNRIVTINHPLPRPSDSQVTSATASARLTGLVFSMLVCFSLFYIVSLFIVFIVDQRSSKAKHLQFLSGVDTASYWLAAFVWNLLIVAVVSVLIVVIVLAFQMRAYSEWPVFG